MTRSTRASTQASTQASKEKKEAVVKAKKTNPKKKKEAKPKEEPKEEPTTETKEEVAKTEEKEEEKESKEEEAEPAEDKATVSVEACKQWGAFKTRAAKIVQIVGDKAYVEVNKEKPGRGNFVVRVTGQSKPIVELIGLTRPFSALKALDMDKIGEKVLSAIRATN